MTPEGKVKKAIRDVLDSMGTQYFMPEHMGMGQTGVVDFICCVGGHYLAIEAKAGDNNPTWKQWEFMRDVVNSGGSALVIHEDNVHSLAGFIRSVRTGYYLAPAPVVAGSMLRCAGHEVDSTTITMALPPMPEPKKRAGLKRETKKTEWPK